MHKTHKELGIFIHPSTPKVPNYFPKPEFANRSLFAPRCSYPWEMYDSYYPCQDAA